MKRILTILAAALCLISCNKEVGPEAPAGNKGEGALTAEETFWNIVGELVDRTERTDDYKGKTYKPTIGQPDGGDESIRVVAVNDLGTAVRRYNELVGANITEETASYTYSNPEVGTLTWNLSTDGKSWGTVDVNIPLVPTLQKIIYRSPEQGDVNGSVGDNGSAYYRFGDVIQRTRAADGKTEYWICIRPSFGPEGKGDSHWISVSPPPMDNVWPYYKKEHKPYVASNGFEYGLPYNLGSKLEWHQDMAEMLFAIMYPEQWATNLLNYYTENWLGSPNGLRMFNDFDAENIELHNLYFWKNVQKQWKDKNLVQTLFGVSYAEMEAALNPGGKNSNPGRGIHLLYNGYSWISGNSPKLYEVHYANSTSDNLKKNMHQETTRVVQSQVVDPKKTQVSNINYPLDVYKLSLQRPYLSETRFFGDELPRWIVRYATGQELMENKKNYDPQQPISGFEGDKEIYRYYRDVLTKNLTDEPEISGDMTIDKYSGRNGYFAPGTIVKDEEGSRWICYYGWSELDDGWKVKDHYARFISFDNIKSSGLTTDGTKVLMSTDIVPEKEAPLLATMLTVFLDEDPRSNSGKNAVYKTFREKLWELCEFSTSDRILTRDTLWTYSVNPSITNNGAFQAVSIAYMPQGGFRSKESPYLRAIIDCSTLNEARLKLPASYQYPHLYFYKYYNCENPSDPNKGRILNLFDLFHRTSTIVDDTHTIKSDRWSRAVRHKDGTRDGDFKVSDLIVSDAEVAAFTRARWKSAYHEPVIVARYMAVDDPYPTVPPTLSAGGHKLTILYDPLEGKHSNPQDFLIRIAGFRSQVDFAAQEGYAWMDEQPYDMDLYYKIQ